ncbi:DUF5132 domain-containing protein [Baaleninema simplex]|uniref:DUF5132 domain-containing protein n=1 Tax=Baaleninema simplex TaxID=2862350 RepID=UPI0003460198|nr:DUF5132 domain-containing protein [Baaleninema simplex]
MAFHPEDLLEDVGVPGIAAGIGLLVLAPFAVKAGKPLAKAVIKGGITAYEKSKGFLAETGEVFEDMVAEARAELAEDRSQKVLNAAENTPESS